MAAAFLPADDLHLRRVSARHGYSEVSRGVVGLSLSEIEDIDYLTERPSSRSSLVRFGFLKPPNVVEPINSRAPSMELPNNAAKTVGSLHKAARDGDEDAIANIIQNLKERYKENDGIIKYKLNKKDRSDYTALHYAVRYGHENVAQLLVSSGADIHLAGDGGTQPIHLAARHTKAARRARYSVNGKQAFVDGNENVETNGVQEQSRSILKILLDNGADCNARDACMQTPLHYAALKGNLLAVEILINTQGILLEAEDKSKSTPLHSACSSGSVDVVRRLLISGANFLKCDDEKLTPFHYIVIAGNLELLKDVILQLEKSSGYVVLSSLLADRDDHNQTALHLAVMSGNYETTKLLLEYKSEVNAKRYGMTTPLHLAAANGNRDIVRLLLSYLANIEERNAQGETALHAAAVMNRESVVSFLLENGADVDALSDYGSTPLILAAAMNNSRIVNLLVRTYGAKDDHGDASERTAMYWAAQENAMESLQILLTCENYATIINIGDRYDNTPLHAAAMKGFSGIVRMLLEYGAKLDPVNDEDLTPLHLSAKHGHTRVVQQLLERKPTMVSDEDEAANTALHHASVAGHADVIRVLIEFGAPIDVRNVSLWTPLDCAAAHGRVNAARVLLEREAPVDPVDRAKSTPLHLACKGGYVEMAKLLIDFGADITLCDIEGKNCLDIAVDYGFEDTAVTILGHRDWIKAMQHRTNESGRITTPMRRMIEKLPNVALEVFNKCTEVSRKDDDDCITLYYEFLDDTYSKWSTEEKMDQISGSDFVFDASLLDGLFTDKTSSNRQLDKKENHPLDIMVKHEREKLLSHPLAQSLIHAKWRRFGRLIYYSKLTLFILFLSFLTGYTAQSTPLNPVYQTINGTRTCVSNPLPNTFLVNFFVNGGKVLIMTLAVIQLLFELIQLINKRLAYFASIENYIEVLIFACAIVYVSDFTYGEKLDIDKCGEVHISIGSLTIFLSWTNLLLFLRKFPKFGIYFVMFLDVFKTFLLFSVTFSLFIVAFGLGFYVLLSKQMKPFSSPIRSMVKSVVMMIGEFEFDAIFNESRDQPPYTITWLLFFIFVIMCTIILMNLLVGLAVDDIKTVQDKAALQRIAMQVDLVLEVEKFIPYRLRKKIGQFRINTKEVVYDSQQKSFINRIKPHPASLSTVKDAKKNAKEPIDVVQDNIRVLCESLATLQSEIKSIKQRFDGIEAVLTSIRQAEKTIPHKD